MADNYQEWIERTRAIVDLAIASDAPRWLTKVLQAIKNKPPGQLDWRDDAIQALRENAVETLANVTLTVEQALMILGPDFDWDSLLEPNRTWSNHWLSAASKVGVDDQERQTWWSRLLAAEIQQPGKYSLRTIATMDVLSPDEARLFSRLCSYVWKGTSRPHPIMLPPAGSSLWTLDVRDSLTLQNAGLITRQPQGYAWNVEANDLIVLNLGQTRVAISITKSGHFPVGTAILTEAGEQIWELVDVEYDPAYVDAMLAYWGDYGQVSV